MNEQSEKRQIERFIRGLEKKEVNAFKIYQWIECCHYYEWWNLGVKLSSFIPPNSLKPEYEKRLNFLLSECRQHVAIQPTSDDNLIKGLVNKIESMEESERQEAIKFLKDIGIDLTPELNNLTNTRVRGFAFMGKEYRADSHKQVFMKVMKLVFDQYPNQKEKVLQIQGKKRKYFSLESSELTRYAEQIEGSNIYAELNENANTLYNRSKKIIRLYGLDDGLFKILTN